MGALFTYIRISDQSFGKRHLFLKKKIYRQLKSHTSASPTELSYSRPRHRWISLIAPPPLVVDVNGTRSVSDGRESDTPFCLTFRLRNFRRGERRANNRVFARDTWASFAVSTTTSGLRTRLSASPPSGPAAAKADDLAQLSSIGPSPGIDDRIGTAAFVVGYAIDTGSPRTCSPKKK